MFKKVDPKQSLPKMEEEILKFWEENKIFEKSVEGKPADKPFVFYEGPPTANGEPGLHHVLARAFKDLIPRYKTMKGFRVERKAGWDTHGLPVEIQVEKELGLKSKQEIENIVPGDKRESIIEFNKKCKQSVWKYKDIWEKMTKRMAYWVDMENPYITYENKYIESVWWIFAQIFKTKNKKGESLVYKGHKVVPYCYRCGTALSSHEVAQGYKKIKENSVYIKFKVKSKDPEWKNTSILAWTTTPWTLPGNVALAVNPKIEYVCVPDPGLDDNWLVLGKDSFNALVEKGLFPDKYKELKKDKVDVFCGSEMEEIEYEPLYETNDTDKKAYYVISGDFVSTEEGTGVVHIAPAFGIDDAEVGKVNDLPTLITVDEKGEIIADVPGKGIPVKKKDEEGKYKADKLIVNDLKKRGLLFGEELCEHEYPFCWRCDTPLIYYAKSSWFIRMSELRDELVKNNENINWIPDYIKTGRFGEWLKDAKDWAISRERYWGTPLPIWECEECKNLKVIESLSELEGPSGEKFDDLHKPFIDDAVFKCECGGEMKRVPEVMDVWFDSGSMPLAQLHYPFENDKSSVDNRFPADFICEAIDQTRGWFYTLHAIATLLNQAKKVPVGNAFKNVICLGHILDAKGQKMSKSKGNIIPPMKVMDEFGSDVLRWMLYTINQPGLPKRVDIKGMRDVINRVFRMLWNSYYFFVMYANIDRFKPKLSFKKNQKLNFDNLLDKWIVSELNILVREVDDKLNNYDIYSAAGMIEKFIDNLSNWYIRRSRKRFWKSENDEDKNNAYETLHYVLVTLAKVMAPFTPFVSEEIYRNLTSPLAPLLSKEREVNSSSPLQGEDSGEVKSVHLADFPEADKKLIDEKLNEEMKKVREIVSVGLQKRAEAKIKVRQPLSALNIKYRLSSIELTSVIKEELNVKEVVVDEKQEEDIKLNTEITEELKLEGIAREIIRHIQEMRKEAGYNVDDRIKVWYTGQSEVFSKFGEMIAKEVLAEGLNKGKAEGADLTKEFEIEEEKVEISIKR